MLHVLNKKFTGESSNASTLATNINLSRVDKRGLLQKSTSDLNEEYKDSLEIGATNRNRVRDEIKDDPFDTVEQDSLETTKIDTNHTNEGSTQFFPFAQIGTNWSSQECAAQNSTCEFNNSSTNQNVVENESINTINELQTNSTISTNQSIDHDSRDLPGILNSEKKKVV